MPPRSRAAKTTKILKENVGVEEKPKSKATGKVVKPTRKVLGDKTNSASDDNESVEVSKKTTKSLTATTNPSTILTENANLTRPRRERRLPKRFIENNDNKSNNNESIEISKQTAKNLLAPTKSTKTSPENANIIKPRPARRLSNRLIEKNKSNIDKSIETSKQSAINLSATTKPTKTLTENAYTIKPHPEKRLPNRFTGNKSSENVADVKDDSVSQSSFKTPQKVTDTSLIAARPRRISRLPSRFEDHSMSPSKFIPVKPFQSSTPISQKTVKLNEVKNNKVNEETVEKVLATRPQRIVRGKNTAKEKQQEVCISPKINNEKPVSKSDTNYNAKTRTLRGRKNVDTQKEVVPTKAKNTKSTAKTEKIATPIKLSPKKPEVVTKNAKKVVFSSPVKKTRQNMLSPVKEPISNTVRSSRKKVNERPLNKDYSFKIFENTEKNDSNVDVYEFTFDPDEEPTPQKKKKKPVKRKPAKPKQKTIVFKNNYDQNVKKALAALKHVVAKKPAQETNPQKLKPDLPTIQVNDKAIENTDNVPHQQIESRNIPQPQIQRNVASKIIIGNSSPEQPTINGNAVKNGLQIQQNVLIHSPKHQTADFHINNTTMAGLINSANASKFTEQNKSVRVEDIEADFECDLNYSPVYSPARPVTPVAQIRRLSVPDNTDPLNLKDNSFFEQNPVASSSMNRSTSIRQPQETPWRADFENLPIRWHVNSYVKPNMTPAVECSFINFEDKNKKHVYTNLVPVSNDNTLPEIVQNDQQNLKQTSMFDFIKQQVEKSSAKKKRDRSVTPVSASLFKDTADKTPNNDNERVTRSMKQLFTPKKNDKNNLERATVDSNTSEDKESSKDSSRGRKRKNDEEVENAPPKTPRKDKDDMYFGFDETDNIDQENLSPKKKVEGRKRAMRPRARAVLKEINEQGPTRGAIPLAAKTALNAEVERLYNEMKSASDAPVFPEKEQGNIGTTNISDPVEEMTEETVPSVHLFEDVEEIVHHVKPQRKSYGKAKKVTFRQASTDDDTQDEAPVAQSDRSDAEEDLDDLTFDPGVPFEEEKKKKKKKMTKKQKMSKKEEEEAEAWAAGFNSMCEDVDEFPLVIE